MAHASARGVALSALRDWRHGRRFADAILQQLLRDSRLDDADRSYTTELFYGILRNLTLLDFWISRLRSGSLDDASRDLLRLGLYQVFCLHTPAHAAVFETVELASRSNRALVNAVLRNAVRHSEELGAAAAAESVAVRTSHPRFLVERWTNAFGPQDAEAICEWNNQPARVYARINRLKADVRAFVAADGTRELLPGHASFVRLSGVPLESLRRGECYIQDPSTSVACELLDPQPGETVLDACAAPGGKSGLLAELMQNRGQLIACDRDANRVETLRENLQRLGVIIGSPVEHDWHSGPLSPVDAPLFDRILVDAPCTNTGVMRRRVDLRWRLSPADFSRMPDEQFQILGAVLPNLKPGGTLVYSTCSIEREENEQVIERTLETFPFLKLDGQKSVLPFRDGFDGAFAARLLRLR